MMRKVTLVLLLICIVGALGNSVQAATTTSTLNGANNSHWFIPDGYDPYPGDSDYFHGWPDVDKYYRAYNEDWGWEHKVDFTLPGPITVLGATLTIEAWDVDSSGGVYPTKPDEIDLIKVGTSSGYGGVEVGNLTGIAQGWTTTVFELDETALSKLIVTDDSTGTLQVWMDISSLEGTGNYTTDWWYVTLKSATLTVDYIPAPGAIILGSLGAGLVGWLRKRRTL